ncbi:hypothetical protein, partial [Lacticaseibacillus sp. 53-4]|uniref:hypothetical protein n=1 Tax=Lacticaseibacillus sp. 53-4 TaxID=2799575 RepID=UPI0019411DB7
ISAMAAVSYHDYEGKAERRPQIVFCGRGIRTVKLVKPQAYYPTFSSTCHSGLDDDKFRQQPPNFFPIRIDLLLKCFTVML